jgi:cysteine desulfurase
VNPTIYFDYNATTPLDPQVRESMLPFLGDIYGNPSSIHHVGRKARSLLDDARDRVAHFWKSKPSEVVFTSGGTESNNLAIFGAARLLREKGRHLITSRIEHHAVLNCFEYLEKKEGFTFTYLPVNSEGLVSPEDLAGAIRPDTILVSVMAANNEVGTIQPVAELGALCRTRGVIFHTDAVQWLGKEPFASIHQFNADLVSVCSHKFHGPKGAGALFVRSPLLPDPVQFGGGHENERRAGTENLAAIIGFTEALLRFVNPPVFPSDVLRPLTARLIDFLPSLEGVQFQGSLTTGLANTVAFTIAGCDSISLLAGLDLRGICASAGAACSAGSLNPSHVLLAMDVDPLLANSLIRFSLGRSSTLAEVALVEQGLKDVIKQARCL